ncbi:MAG: DUF2232 domain-containing protein [gamma proteobacterium symbiont of Phacoides pectinatus]
MLVSVLAMLSILIPPLSVFSSALVALVTLRQGPVVGLSTGLLAGLACSVLALVVTGGVVPVLGFLLLLWFPVWLLALLLRMSRSLALSLQGALLLGVLFVGLQLLGSQDPVAQWRGVLEPFVESLVQSQLIEAGQRDELIGVMARWMPGVVSAGFLLQMMMALFVARWWQAMLYNPGGFRSEFHQLRMPRYLAIVTLGVLALQAMGTTQSLLPDYLAVLLMAVWFIQGLALAHGAFSLLGSGGGWLVGIYALLLLAMPHAVSALAAAGFADAWFDFRARLRGRNGTGEAG